MLETMALRDDSTALLSSIRMPTCIIAGEEDAIIPLADVEMMHAEIEASEFHIIPKTGHISNVENPPAFNEIVKAFCQRIAH